MSLGFSNRWAGRYSKLFAQLDMTIPSRSDGCLLEAYHTICSNPLTLPRGLEDEAAVAILDSHSLR